MLQFRTILLNVNNSGQTRLVKLPKGEILLYDISLEETNHGMNICLHSLLENLCIIWTLNCFTGA